MPARFLLPKAAVWWWMEHAAFGRGALSGPVGVAAHNIQSFCRTLQKHSVQSAAARPHSCAYVLGSLSLLSLPGRLLPAGKARRQCLGGKW